MASANVYLGCPLWAHPPWVGRFFTADARREDYLPQYASVFGTAEGNATFYGLPTPETVKRWAGEAPPHFHFCFKFPREISHERQLRDAGEATARFFERLAPLADRMGPCFLQLHQAFGPERLRDLAAYLTALPKEHAYAVEVRHPAFFDGGDREAALDRVLREHGVDRVLFDTRGLFASAAQDEATLDAKRRKPRVPYRETVTGRRPFVRFVGDPELERNAEVLAQWARVVAGWMAAGLTPYFFLHHPDDLHAPALVRRFQQALFAANPAAPAPAVWPCERPIPGQLSLF